MSINSDNDYDEEVAAIAAEQDEPDYDDEEEEPTNGDIRNSPSDDEGSVGSDDRAGTPVPSEAASEAVIVADDSDDDEILTATAVAVDDEGGAKRRKKPGPKPKRKRIESDREEAATEARAMLLHTVSRLPMAIGESHVVRAMGRIRTDGQNYSNQNHIYPVGFSCDRYEFSPVHGRILKLRCTILDGKKIRARQEKLGKPVTAPDGPVFRIMWGAGIDDDNESPTEYRYNVERYSAAITKTSNLSSIQKNMKPEEGLRVRVKYERNQWYSGTIVDVDDNGKGETEITVQYDDGSMEHAIYPDPDITLYLPGASLFLFAKFAPLSILTSLATNRFGRRGFGGRQARNQKDEWKESYNHCSQLSNTCVGKDVTCHGTPR
jgi:F/Y-rich N-terminus